MKKPIINAKLFKREDMLVGVKNGLSKGLTQIMFVRIKMEILVINATSVMS